jgi:hypothetical protein
MIEYFLLFIECNFFYFSISPSFGGVGEAFPPSGDLGGYSFYRSSAD